MCVCTPLCNRTDLPGVISPFAWTSITVPEFSHLEKLQINNPESLSCRITQKLIILKKIIFWNSRWIWLMWQNQSAQGAKFPKTSNTWPGFASCCPFHIWAEMGQKQLRWGQNNTRTSHSWIWASASNHGPLVRFLERFKWREGHKVPLGKQKYNKSDPCRKAWCQFLPFYFL